MTDKHTFYVPPGGFDEDRVTFPDGEARHALRVLRLVEGNEVQVVDGDGGRFRVRIDRATRRTFVGTVLETLPGEPAIRPELVLGVGLVKNAGRFETVLEKAAELGAARVVPLITERTEARRFRADRGRSILVSAMKQCGRARLVALDDPVPLETMLGGPAEGLRLICHESAPQTARIPSVLGAGAVGGPVTLLVGPEGGFSDGEIAAAVEAGYRPVSLGPTRLRTETAAIAAVTLVLLGADD